MSCCARPRYNVPAHTLFHGRQVAAGDIASIDHIQAGVQIRRHRAPQEINDDLPRRRRLAVALADRRGGIDDDDGKSLGRKFQGNLLGQVFGAFVGSFHLRKRYSRVFVAPFTIGGQADAADGRSVDDPFDAGVSGGLKNVPGPFDIGGENLGGVRRPQPIISGDVKQFAATIQSASEEAGSRRSPLTASTGRSAIPSRLLDGRTRTRTERPCSTSRRATCPPRNPEAPVRNVTVRREGSCRGAAYPKVPASVGVPPYDSAQLSIFKLSPSRALTPRAADGS